jgi:hypothetical protein
MTSVCRTLMLVAVLCYSGRVQAQVPEYTPQQVYTIYYDAISQALGFSGSSTHYLSLTAVGRVVQGTDQAAQVSDLSNFCPPAKPILDSFANAPKLDAIYERILNGAVGPEFAFSNAYREAEKVIKTAGGDPTDEFTKYLTYRRRHTNAIIKLRNAITPEERLNAQDDVSIAYDQLNIFGFRAKIEGALGVLDAEQFQSGATQLYRRQQILRLYRETALNGKDAFKEDFRSPFSEFSPGPSEWSADAGWTTLDYSTSARFSSYSHSSSEKRGFGGLSLGFCTIGGSVGGSSSVTHKVSKVSELAYKIDLLRVGIRRNWLDASLFFDPTAWTWKKLESQDQFPRVAVALNQNGVPIESQIQNYNNARVSFAMLPLEAIVARNVSVTATVTKADYEQIKSASSASGGATLFGIFGGGGSGKWSYENVEDNGSKVRFTVRTSGPVVIGYISQILPLCPNPNANATWPAHAQLP